ncbi:hypothetical protein Tco_1547588 [Tanacetum coccineum]
MSDSEDSTVTNTDVSSEFEDLSDIGSPGVIVHKYDGLPMMPEDTYAYVEAAMQEPAPPDYVPDPVYPEFMQPEDDVLPAEEQPLPTVVSPTTDSPGYITESDPEEDPKEEDDEDPEEDPADYPTDRDDDEEEESSRDDADDEEEDEGKDEEEEEEHLASTDSIPPPPPLPVYRTTARISIRAQIPTLLPSEAEVDRLLALPTPPPSPLTPLSSPLPQISSSPLLVSPPLPISPSPLPASPTHSLGYRAAMIQRESNFVMSDSEDSTVTYTEVSSEFEDLSDIGSPRVIVHGYNGLPMMIEDPYAYVEAAMQEAPPLDYDPEPPLPAAVSPTADSPGYIIESDPEEDPKEEDDEDPEEDPADYPTDRDDDDDKESFIDDVDDEEEDEGEDEEEEEHLAPTDSIPPPPPSVYRTTARMSIRAKIPTPLPSKAEVDRLLTLPTPPPSPLTPLSSSLPHIPSSPLPVSPPLPISPLPLPASPTNSLGYRAAMIR